MRDSTPHSQAISKDDAYHLLQNARRRAVLRYLLAHDEDRFRMRDLAEEVGAWEHDTTVKHLTSDERQRVYIALYQSHLPKLDAHGIITYDRNRGIIEQSPLIHALAPYLDEGLHGATSDVVVPEDGTQDRGLPAAISTVLSR